MVVWHLVGGHMLPQEQLAFLSHLPLKIIIVVPFARIKNNPICIFYVKNFSVTPNNPHRESLWLRGRVPKYSAEFCFLSTKMLKFVRFVKKKYKIKRAGSLPFWIIELFLVSSSPSPTYFVWGWYEVPAPFCYTKWLPQMTPIFAEESKWLQREREIYFNPCFWVFFVFLKTKLC